MTSSSFDCDNANAILADLTAQCKRSSTKQAARLANAVSISAWKAVIPASLGA